MSTFDIQALGYQYRESKRKVAILADMFDEAGRNKDLIGEQYEQAVENMESLHKSIMEAFANSLEDEDTVQ
jgi:hypothetical protein